MIKGIIIKVEKSLFRTQLALEQTLPILSYSCPLLLLSLLYAYCLTVRLHRQPVHFHFELTETNPTSGREEDLNPGPPDYKSSALTSRPRRLPFRPRAVVVLSSGPRAASDNAYNAWFNSCCYHPPWAHPWGVAIFSSIDVLFPTPGHAERDNSPAPGLLTSAKNNLLPLRKNPSI